MSRNSRPAATLTIILISYFMILLDDSVVFTGLPSIREVLELSPTGLSWVQDAHTLVFGGAASGLVDTAHQFGTALGLAVLSAVALRAGAGPAVARPPTRST